MHLIILSFIKLTSIFLTGLAGNSTTCTCIQFHSLLSNQQSFIKGVTFTTCTLTSTLKLIFGSSFPLLKYNIVSTNQILPVFFKITVQNVGGQGYLFWCHIYQNNRAKRGGGGSWASILVSGVSILLCNFGAGLKFNWAQ